MKSFSIKIGEGKEEWDGFVKASPQGSIFLFSKLLDSLCVRYELVTCYDGNQIVAGVPIFFEKDGSLKRVPNVFMMYQGVLLKDSTILESHRRISYEFKVVSYLLNEICQRYSSLCFINSWKYQDVRPFQWVNYHESEKGMFNIVLRYTGILALDKYENFSDYLGKIRQLRRREFKKLKEFYIEETKDVDLFLEYHDKTYQRQGIETPDKEYRCSIVERSLQMGYGKMAKACTRDGQVASVMLFFYDDHTAYYLFGANNPLERRSGGATVLMLDFIRNAFEKNLKYVDFCGVNSPNRGDYKISFNAELYPYFLTSYKARS